MDTDAAQLFLSDPDAKFSKSIGWSDPNSGRTGRYAIVIDHGKVKYAQVETEKGVVKVSDSSSPTAMYHANPSSCPAPTPCLPICEMGRCDRGNDMERYQSNT